jgi:hypothetical protein
MDDRIRSLAREARAEVERSLDLDRELADTLARGETRIGDVSERDVPRPRLAPWVAAAAVVVTFGVAALWLTRDSSDDSVLTADVPSTELAATVTMAEPQATSTALPVATAVSTSPSTSAVSETTTTNAATAATATTVDSPAIVLPTPGRIDLSPSDLIARETDGDVWWFPGALSTEPGEPVLMIDREDPRIVPEEGEPPNVVDEVAGTFDGALIYSDCCEPVSGNVYAIGEPGAEIDRSLPTGRSDRFQLWGVGTNPKLEPGGTTVLTQSWVSVALTDMRTGDRQVVSTNRMFGEPELDAVDPPFEVVDTGWTPTGTVALLGRSDTGSMVLSERPSDDVRVELRRTELAADDVATQGFSWFDIVGTTATEVLVAEYSTDGVEVFAVDMADWAVREAVLPFDVAVASDFVRVSADGSTAAWIVDGVAFLQRVGEAPVEWRADIAEIWFPSIESSRPIDDAVAGTDRFITAPAESGAVIDLRDADGVVATRDLGCPEDRVCSVESARLMGSTIWATIVEREGSVSGTVTGTRVVSASQAGTDVTVHLALTGPTIARSAGLGADGVLYVQLNDVLGPGSSLVAVEDGETRELSTGVSSMRLSDDGRLLAVSSATPSEGARARLEFDDLVDGRTNEIQTDYVNAGPAVWSSDGRHLIVAENWEDGAAWVIDPWSDSADPILGTDRFLDGACFVDDDVIAHRTWNIGYGQGDAQPGVVRLTSIAAGATVAELGTDLFGEYELACLGDGALSFVRRPVVEVEFGAGFSQLEPDDDEPGELVRVDSEGTVTVMATGDLRLF